MNDHPPQTLGVPAVPAAADQVQAASAPLRQQLAAAAADSESIGARCAGVLAAARQLEDAAAADLRAAQAVLGGGGRPRRGLKPDRPDQ